MLFSVALAVRLFAWQQTAVLFNDGPVYLALAKAILAGEGGAALSHPYHPLYPALIALGHGAGLPLETAAVAISIGGGLLMIAGLWGLLDAVFNREIAFLGAWILALHPWAVDFSADVMSDALYGGFFLSSLALLARSLVASEAAHRDKKPSSIFRPAVGCGLCIGLAYAVRPEGLGLLAVVGVAFAALIGRRQKHPGTSLRDLRKEAIALASLVAAVGLVALPYIATISAEAGTLVLSAKKSVSGLARGESDPAVILEDGTWTRAPATNAKIWLPQSSASAYRPTASPPPRDFFGFIQAASLVLRTSLASLRYEVAFFAVIGILALGTRHPGPRWRGLLIASSALLYSGLLVLLVWGAGYVSRRHALVALLPMLGYAAVGWRWGVHRLLERFSFPMNRFSFGRVGQVGLLLIVALFIAWGPRNLRERREERRAVREAAEWIAATHPESGPVAAQKLRTAYYAQARFVPIPSGLDGALRAHLTQGHARWLVIDESRLGDHLGLRESVGDWLRVERRVTAGTRTALVLDVMH